MWSLVRGDMEELLITFFISFFAGLLAGIFASIVSHFIIKKIEDNQKKSSNISKQYKVSLELIIHFIKSLFKKNPSWYTAA
jgi:NhaP-type Na+/H+ or K+/H+ antiporter